jgi:hypothetical protein
MAYFGIYSFESYIDYGFDVAVAVVIVVVVAVVSYLIPPF